MDGVAVALQDVSSTLAQMNKCQPKLDSRSYEEVSFNVQTHLSLNATYCSFYFTHRTMPTDRKCWVVCRPVSPLEWLEIVVIILS